MIVLVVDLFFKVVIVVLMKDDKLFGEIILNDKKEYFVILMIIIEDLLKFNNLIIDDIDGYVVFKGFGFFIGFRIGMVIVKGFSFGSGKFYVSLFSLDVLVFSVVNFDGFICLIMDVLRNSVYILLYKSCNGLFEKFMDYFVFDMDEFVEMIKFKGEKVIFIGDGLDKYKDYLIENCLNCYFFLNYLNLVCVLFLGEIGSKLLKDG